MANKGAFASEQRFNNRNSVQSHLIPTSATFPTTQYSFGTNMPCSSTIPTKHQYFSLQKVPRPLQTTKSSSASSSANIMTKPSTVIGTNFNNSVSSNNHSTVLLNRPSIRPPLGIKASNLPISRNLSAQQTSMQSSNYKSTMIGGINNKASTSKKQILPSTHILSNLTTISSQNEYSQQHDYTNRIDSRNTKSLFIILFFFNNKIFFSINKKKLFFAT